MKYRFYSPVQGIIDYDFNKDMDYDSYFDEEAMEELGEVDFDFLTAEVVLCQEKVQIKYALLMLSYPAKASALSSNAA